MPGRSDNLLIVCFSFPPFPGIGGRRWAKFAKFLAQNNFTVHTLSAKNNSLVNSEWTKDVSHANIIKHTFELGISKVLSFPPSTIFQKIIYKLLWNLSPILIQGNPQDKVYFVKGSLLKQAEEIITNNAIKTVIVTIPPFKMAYYLLALKTKFPDLKFIVDYRDPWTDNRSFHGFHNLEAGRLKQELEYEKEVLNKYDAILDVNDESLEHLKEKISNKNKFYHLPNGFDSDDYKNYSNDKKKEDDKIRFVFSGSFYPNLIYLLDPLLNCIRKIKEQDNGLYSKLEFNFYGNMDHNAQELVKKSNLAVVKFHGSVPQNVILSIITAADYCLLFSAADHGSAFNTKFYEALYFRKPIVCFGPSGKLSDHIIQNNLGVAITSQMLETGNPIIELIKTKKQFNSNAGIGSFDIKNITNKLMDIINE